MLIGKGAGCFKCYFQKLEQFLWKLGNYFPPCFPSLERQLHPISLLILGILLSFFGVNKTLLGPFICHLVWHSMC